MTVGNGICQVERGATLDAAAVLLVEGDARGARATTRLLVEENEAFDVETAGSLRVGRRRFADLDPDCVVCDSRLRDGDGLELLETVRETDPDRPFVLVTGRGDESVASEAIARGATDCVRKDGADAADLLANRVENAVRAYRSERALARTRNSSASLLDALPATASRDELLEGFCRHLVEERHYARAWIGAGEGPGTVVPVASADDGRHETPSVADPSPTANGHPAVAAVDRDAPVVVGPLDDRTSGEDSRSTREERLLEECPLEERPHGEGWWAHARERGVEHVAAVPIGGESVRYGALVVEAAAPIDDAEGRLLRDYADTICDVIRSTESNRSTAADRLTSTDVDVRDASLPLVALLEALGDGVRIEVPSAADRGDGTTLYVANVEGADASGVTAAAAAVDGLELTGTDADREPVRCELLAEPPTPERLLADHGARFEQTVVERGTATTIAHLPDGGISAVASSLDAAFERTELSTTSSARADGRSRSLARGDALQDLTDRQRDVLLYAFHAGYYEIPRGVSATELAERFDVARATLTQHLRTAERKVFGEVLSE